MRFVRSSPCAHSLHCDVIAINFMTDGRTQKRTASLVSSPHSDRIIDASINYIFCYRFRCMRLHQGQHFVLRFCKLVRMQLKLGNSVVSGGKPVVFATSNRSQVKLFFMLSLLSRVSRAFTHRLTSKVVGVFVARVPIANAFIPLNVVLTRDYLSALVRVIKKMITSPNARRGFAPSRRDDDEVLACIVVIITPHPRARYARQTYRKWKAGEVGAIAQGVA